MNKNFAGQNLNGRSFCGQDLRGADFSGCQLKGCDFTNADLTGAKFCRSTMGVNGQRNILKWALALILGTSTGFLAWLLNKRSVDAINEVYKTLTGANALAGENYDLPIVGSLFGISVFLFVFAALKYRNWEIVGWYYIVIILVGAIAGAIVGAAERAEEIVVAVAVAVAVAGAEAVAAAVLATLAAACVGALAAMAAVAVAVTVVDGVVEGELAAAAITFISLLLGWYIDRRTMQFEDPMLEFLRSSVLFFRCWGGTKFPYAMLARTDFTGADLASASFDKADFRQTDFTHAQNLHLAWTYASPLEHKAVRTLLAKRQVGEQDFSYLNLRGLSFKELVLTDCNFHHADLSEADFNGCNLTGADLSEAIVLGTRFSNATMTGAIIDNWNMNKKTGVDHVVCDFVYIKRDRSERNPPQGEFKPDEFSKLYKLYQEIANTVDFIAHNMDELEALVRAINSIKQQGRDIEIQSLERKNESVVVRTQSIDVIDKAAIYAEVKAQTEKELLVLQQEKQLLLQKVEMQEQHTDTLKQLLNKAIESPKTMNDNSRHYSNITAHNSALNLGDGSTVSNHIEQVADAELKAALQTLQQLLANSHLPDIDKQQARQAVDELAAVSQKPQAERKSLARRSLAFLKDLQQDLSSVAELGEQYGKLLIKVMAWF